MKKLFYGLAFLIYTANVYSQSSLKTFIGLPLDTIGPEEIEIKSQVIASRPILPPKFPDIPIEELHPFILTTATLSNSARSVGEIPYTTSVTPMGGMTVSVPLEVYEAPKGPTPEIALTYNSMGGDGPLGYGWSLTGVSAISLSNKTIYYDGKTEGITANYTDAAYLLDGQRLIRTGSTAQTVSFQTEQGHIKVTGHTNNNYIVSFEVWHPDGRRGVYASETADGNSFYLTTLTDNENNAIHYYYEQPDANHPHRLKRITYGVGEIASIEFEYEERKEVPLQVYINGNKQIIDYLLKSIISTYNGFILRTYNLENVRKGNSYEIGTIKCTAARKFLNPLVFYYGGQQEIPTLVEEEVDLKDWHHFKDIYELRVSKGKFEYGSQNDGLITAPNKIHFLEYWQGNAYPQKSKYEIRNQYNGEEEIEIIGGLGGKLLDTNERIKTGKGFVDVFCMDADHQKGDEIIKINQYTIRDQEEILEFHIYGIEPGKGITKKHTYAFYEDNLPSHKDVKSINPKFFFPGDYDGDGKMELLAVSADNVMGCHVPTTCQLIDLENRKVLYKGTPFTFYQQFPKLNQSHFEITPEDAYNNSDKLYTMDYNGDGKTDLCLINKNGMYIYTFDINLSSHEYTCREVASDPALNTDLLREKELFVGEFNGDGLNDLLLSSKLNERKDSWKIYFSKGNGKFQESLFPCSPRIDKEEQYIVQDIDGDGQTDLVRIQADKWTTINILYILNGKIRGSDPYTLYEKALVIPTEIQNKNYFNHFVAIQTNGKAIGLVYRNNEYKKKMLTGITGSHQEVTKIGYLPLNDKKYEIYHSSDYVPATSSYAQYQDYNGGLIVVSNVATFYNEVVLKDLHYEYANGVIHKQGLGFRGFQKVVCHQKEDGKEKQYVQIYNPLNYSVLMEEDGPEEKNIYQWEVMVFPQKNLTTRITRKETTDKLRNITFTADYLYDSYDNLTKETLDYGSGLSATTYNTYENVNTASAYLPGLLKTQKVVHKRDGGSFTSQTEYTYNSHHLPVSKIEKAGSYQIAEEAYEYDDKLNLKTLKTRPYSSTNWQTETYTYDDQGRITLKIDPIGTYTAYAYAARGPIANTHDQTGHYTVYAYDEWLRNIKTTYPDGTIETTAYTWDSEESEFGYLVTTTRTGKPEHRAYINGLGQTIKEGSMRFDGEFIYTRKEYDKKGRLSAESHPFKTSASLWDRYFYDDYGRLTLKAYASGKQDNYSYKGLTETSVINGITSTKTYDAAGTVTQITDEAGTISYFYRPDGQLAAVTAPGNVTTEFAYDIYGRRTAIRDPSAGTKTFDYDNAGNVIRETDANGLKVEMTYDVYNRLTSKTLPDVNVRYIYTTQGLLAGVSGNTHQKRYIYDQYQRINRENENLPDGKYLYKTYAYNEEGNLASITYTSHLGEIGTEYYDYAYGNLRQINWGNGTVIWKLIQENARGQATQVLTNGINRTYVYDDYGFPLQREITQGGRSIQKFEYLFDKNTGNLKMRKDKGATETFQYDRLNRLIYASTDGNITYDEKGNIQERDNVGSYFYATDKPYQLAEIQVARNSTSPNQQKITYNAMMRPITISEKGYTATFTYNGDYNRVSMELKKGTENLLERYYIGDSYETDIKPTGTTQKLYLGGDAYSAPVLYYQGRLYNICRDYLGSVTLITNNIGSIVEERSYDAWGRLRDPKTHQVYGANEQPELIFARGYTGHEHLQPFCLINMNARLYAPSLGRFLSPDPYVQAPDFSQNFNRYAYCLNNPLAFNDQDGEFWNFIIGGLVGGLVNWIAHGCKFNAKGLGYFGVGAAAGALGAGIGTGITATFTPGLTFGAGFIGTQTAMHAISSSFSTSFISGMAIGAGAGFGSGFVSGLGNGLVDGNRFGASLGKGFMDGIMGGISGGIVGGLAGGISAAIDGRRFWDGALINKATLVDRNLPFISSQGANNCAAANAESITKGEVTQNQIRTLLGGDPATDPLIDVEVFKKITELTGREWKAIPRKIGSNSLLTKIAQQGHEVSINLEQAGGAGHMVSLNKVVEKTIIKTTGRVIKKTLYYVMDPSRGQYTRMSSRNLNNWINAFQLK